MRIVTVLGVLVGMEDAGLPLGADDMGCWVGDDVGDQLGDRRTIDSEESTRDAKAPGAVV